MKRHHRMLLLGFFLPLLAIGLPYWQPAYNSAETQLPNAFYGWPLVLVFFAAVASRLAGAGVLPAWLVVGTTLPVIVMARVVRDTAADPTTHTLWPLELLIAGALGFGVALLGTLAAQVALRLRAPPAGADH